MKWNSGKKKPKADGMYYIREIIKYESANYKGQIRPYYRIETYSYTVEGGWGTYYWYDGSLIGGTTLDMNKFEWSEVDYEPAR